MTWISVRHHLPDSEVNVLVSNESEILGVAFWVLPIGRQRGWYFLDHFKVRGHVTHWAPIPGPPKKEKNRMTFLGTAKQERVDRRARLSTDLKAELEAAAQDRKDLESLMLYVDEAKNAAQLGGRIAGEPLADFIKQIIEDTR